MRQGCGCDDRRSGNVRSVRISDDLHLAVLDRGGGRAMRLFSREARDYPYFDGLPSVENTSAHLRRHPLTGEWIAYSAARQGRTMLPDAHDCPLCPMRDASRLTDVPVADYEVAIFSNRFAALLPDPGTPPELALSTRSGAGLCEVISYSADHAASLSSIGPGRIALLVDALADRVPQIMQNPDIAYVLPFENRGREIGVTLDHPHGQIYGLSHLPQRIRQTAEGFRDGNPLAGLATAIPDELKLAENDTGIAFVPPWARYPFEVWVVPHERVPDMSRLNAAARRISPHFWISRRSVSIPFSRHRCPTLSAGSWHRADMRTVSISTAFSSRCGVAARS